MYSYLYKLLVFYLKGFNYENIQVKSNNVWKYVFGYKGGTKEIITLRDDQRNIALGAIDLPYFRDHYSREFRAV